MNWADQVLYTERLQTDEWWVEGLFDSPHAERSHFGIRPDTSIQPFEETNGIIDDIQESELNVVTEDGPVELSDSSDSNGSE